MNLINYLQRPEYLFRPIQIYRRIRRSFNRSKNEFEDVPLPWGIKIKVRPDEVIGRSILGMGIYDLSVTEVIWRLIDQGETAIDIGANIGYMSSIMARQVGKTGNVYCFEPHPEIYEELSANISMWQNSMGWHQIKSQRIALSNESGEAVLNIPNDFIQNRGTATLFSSKDIDYRLSQVSSPQTYLVSLSTLDEFIKINQLINIGVIKIDVEGHELEVLQGAFRLISKQQVRDIIFEDHKSYPSTVTQFLEDNGYTIFRIFRGFWRPLLAPPMTKHIFFSQSWEPPSYLATKAPSRAMKHMQKRGWNSL